MRNTLCAFLLTLFFVPHFSYADNSSVNSPTTKHHQVHHASSRSKSHDMQPVDLNQASVAELSTLKGVGPKKASDIVAYRKAHGNFQTINDLTKVKGIGAKTLARLEKNNAGRIVVNKA